MLTSAVAPALAQPAAAPSPSLDGAPVTSTATGIDDRPAPDRLANATNVTRRSVTLLTGQTVTVVERGNRTSYRTDADVPMHQVSTAQGTYVFPEGTNFTRFEPHLFNVDLLVNQNLTDTETDSIPVIVSERAETEDRTRYTEPGSDGTTTREPGPRESGTRSAANALESAPGARSERALEAIDAHAGSVRKGETRAAYESLAGSDRVDSVSLDIKYRVDLAEAATNVSAPAARQRFGVSGEGIRVAIVDSGIDATHPDLQGRVVEEKDFTSDGTTADLAGHGTHVAGIVAGDGTASNGTYVGMAPNASLINAKGLRYDGTGYSSWIIDAIEYAVTNDADVVSLSIGGPVQGVRSDDRYTEVIDYAVSNGVTVVASAGNDGEFGYQTVNTPGIQENAITVGATDGTYMADFSSRGPTPAGHYLKPNLVAPGVNIASTASGQAGYTSSYVAYDGTSMSTPMVSGIAALMLEEHPGWTPGRVKNVLTSTADPLASEDVYTQGAGQVNATDAVAGDIVVNESTIDFGTYSSDTTVTRTVNVTNLGETNKTLNVSVDATSNIMGTGSANVSVDTENVTLNGSESALVNLTVDTNVSNGVYSGRLSFNGDEYTAVFGFVRAHNVTVEKSALSGTNASDDYVWLFANESGTFMQRGMAGYKQLSSGSASYSVIRGGDYQVVSGGINEANGQPVLVSRSVTVDGSETVNLDESSTVELRLNTSELEAEHGSMLNRSIKLDYERWTDDWSTYSGGITAPNPDTTTVRVSEDARLDVGTNYLLVPAANAGGDAFDVPAVYHLTKRLFGVDGPTSFGVDRSSLARKQMSYYRGSAGESYNATLVAESGLFTSEHAVRAGIGDRRHQTIYVSPDYFHWVDAESKPGTMEWNITDESYWIPDPGESQAFDLNRQPYLGYYSGTVYDYSGTPTFELYGYPQIEQGVSLGSYRDARNDTVTVWFNGSQRAKWNTTERMYFYRNETTPGTNITVRTVARRGWATLSTRTVSTYRTTYDPDYDSDAPKVFAEVSHQRTNNTAPNGTVEIKLDTVSWSNVSDVRVLVANDSVDTVPFEPDAVNPSGNWTNATVNETSESYYDYVATVDLSDYDGNVSLAIRATDEHGDVFETTTFDGFRVQDFPPEPRFVSNRTTTYNITRDRQPVELNASGSWDNFGIAEYDWTFGDGNQSTGEVVTHTYSDLGNYTVELTANDTRGLTNETTKTIRVVDQQPPAIDLRSNRSLAIDGNESISFDGSGSTDNYGIQSYEWSVSSETDNASTVVADTGETLANYTFPEPGRYTVRLNVTDNKSNVATETREVLVGNFEPSADAGPDRSVNETETVILDATGSDDPDADPLSYEWRQVSGPTLEIEGGSTATPTVTAPDLNVFEETAVFELTVTDDDGATATDLVSVTIYGAITVGSGGDGGGGGSGSLGGSLGGGGSLPPPSVRVSTERPAPNHLVATVANARSGAPGRVDLPGDGFSGDGATFESVSVTPRSDDAEAAFDLDFESLGAAPADAGEPSGAGTVLSYLQVETSRISNAEIQQVRFRYRVAAKRLETTGTLPENVALYRHHGGTWSAVKTTFVEKKGGDYIFEATAPGFSTYAITVQEAAVDVTGVDLSTDAVAPGEAATVTATVENTGDGEGTFVAELTVEGDVVATKEVTVPAGASKDVSFERTFDTAGEYDVGVSGTSAGTLAVSGDVPGDGDDGDGSDGTRSDEGPASLPSYVLLALVALAAVAGAVYYRKRQG